MLFYLFKFDIQQIDSVVFFFFFFTFSPSLTFGPAVMGLVGDNRALLDLDGREQRLFQEVGRQFVFF